MLERIGETCKKMARTVDFSRGALRGRLFSKLTWKILQYLAEQNEPQNAHQIAKDLNKPYKTIHKYLTRLVEKGLVRKPSIGFFEFNHDNPALTCSILYPTYNLCRFLRVHSCGVLAVVPGLWEMMRMVGSVADCDFRSLKSTGYYRGRSPVFGACVKLYEDAVYYKRSSEPLSLGCTFLLYEDVRRTLDYYAGGLTEPVKIVLNDFEVGLDFGGVRLPEGVSRILFYPKHGRVRLHVQVKAELPLPLGPLEFEKIERVWLDAMSVVHRLVDPDYAERAKVLNRPGDGNYGQS